VPGFESRTENDLVANVNTVAPGYFDTYGIRVLRGRPIVETDTAAGPHVAVVSESAARYYFGTVDAIGRRMEIRGSTTLRPEIVGVVADVMYDDLRSGAERMFYVPFSQRFAEGEYQFAVRTAGDTQAIAREIPALMAELAPSLPLLGLDTLSRQVAARATNEWLLAAVSTSLGVLALILAGIGICGIVGYTVARRTAEVGLRVALGATHRHVIWLMTRGSAGVVAVGVAIGIAAAFAASDALTGVLFGLERTDVRVYGSAAAVLFAAGMLAALPPILRALRIEPVSALRCE
jgi:ABC-type antimicrobial peptide transport system permease subunit